MSRRTLEPFNTRYAFSPDAIPAFQLNVLSGERPRAFGRTSDWGFRDGTQSSRSIWKIIGFMIAAAVVNMDAHQRCETE